MIRGRLILVLAAVVGLAVTACGGSSGASGSPAASGRPSAMPAGTYNSTSFVPAVTYTVSDGWVQVSDNAGYLAIQPAATDAVGIYLFHNVSAGIQDAQCSAAAQPGVGTSSVELSTWIRSLPGLSVSAPALVTIGGIPGTSLDISLKSSWTTSCPFAGGLPAVPLLFSSEIDHWVVVGNEQLRLYLLEVPGQGTVLVDIDAFDGSQFQALLAAATPVVKSLTFAGK
ncbi:MAG: hypothetical protein WCK58_08250 [Chloroflexota bacterium]